MFDQEQELGPCSFDKDQPVATVATNQYGVLDIFDCNRRFCMNVFVWSRDLERWTHPSVIQKEDEVLHERLAEAYVNAKV